MTDYLELYDIHLIRKMLQYNMSPEFQQFTNIL